MSDLYIVSVTHSFFIFIENSSCYICRFWYSLIMANETQLSPKRTERIKLNTLAAFGVAVLQIMQDHDEWSGDTLDAMQVIAVNLKLAESKNGKFKSKV